MADKKVKVDSNPMKAYLQGRMDGEKYAKEADIRRGIKLTFAHMLLAMAYVNEKDDETTYLTKAKFRDFYQDFAKTLERFIDESIEGEDGIDVYDIADMYVSKDTFIRDRYGLPRKKYDGKDEVV